MPAPGERFLPRKTPRGIPGVRRWHGALRLLGERELAPRRAKLQRRLPGAGLVATVRFLKQDAVEPESDAIGLVFPIHGLTLPILFGGSPRNSTRPLQHTCSRSHPWAAMPHRAFPAIDRIPKRKIPRLDSFFTLTMPSNDPRFPVLAAAEGGRARSDRSRARLPPGRRCGGRARPASGLRGRRRLPRPRCCTWSRWPCGTRRSGMHGVTPARTPTAPGAVHARGSAVPVWCAWPAGARVAEGRHQLHPLRPSQRLPETGVADQVQGLDAILHHRERAVLAC